MAPPIPHNIKNIRALMQHFVDSESKDSVYELKLEIQGAYSVFTIAFKYKSGNYKILLKANLRVWIREKVLPDQCDLVIRLETDPFHGTEKSSVVIEYAGIFVKMGNLMKQVQALA